MATLPAINDQQSPEASHFSLMQRQARMFAMSPLIPEHLRKGSPDQAMANCYIAMTIADRMGEDRMTVMQNIHIVHGTAGFKTEYKIARANQSGVFQDCIDWDVTGAGGDLSVTAFATLAKTGRRVAMTVDMAMARSEGWTSNKKYQTMPEVMLRYRSASFLIRMYAPQVMLGYQSMDEIEDVIAATAIVSEPVTAQALLAQATDDTINAGEGRDQSQMGGLFTASEADEATATDLIAKVNAERTSDALDSFMLRVRDQIDALPEELAQRVRDAAAERMGDLA